MTPDLLIAGHIVKDVTADGWRPGGGVLYAACQAQRLGLRVAVLTACSADIDPPSLLPGVEWHVQPSETSTTFENLYEDGKRSQRLLARGGLIDFDDAPEGWLDAPRILLTPLFHEISAAAVAQIAPRTGLLGLAAQGWLRQLDGARVRPARFEPEPAWLAGDAVFVSEEDVQEPELVAAWQARVPVVVLTRGRAGCTVWDVAGRHDISTAPLYERDPTGAGDVFAAAFLVRYHETRDSVEAARFAAAAGALSVRGQGYEAVAGRDEIESLLAQGRVKVA